MSKPRTLSSSVSVTRRGFLRLGSASVAAWTLAGPQSLSARPAQDDFRCIFLNLVGGPSHLDTWDPKPLAPIEYRGPFQAIRTNVPGIWISELFPRMARLANRYALVRSLYHDEAPIHETGQQLIQTARISQNTHPYSHVGVELSRNQSSCLLVPGPIHNTGVSISHGQEQFTNHLPLDHAHGAVALEKEPPALREQYGLNHFGQSCLLARRSIEEGVHCVTVNMFQTVYDSLSWDCHADGASLNVNLTDYRDRLAPMFDLAYSSLLLDLQSRGLLQNTLVVASGEFGRSPKINQRGGRDHWTGAWTALFAGAGVQGGQIIGSTDSLGRLPKNRPIHAAAIANTIRHAAGLPWASHYRHDEPIKELFGSFRTV